PYRMLILLIHLIFFTETPTAEIHTLSLHDALPISSRQERPAVAICWRYSASPSRSLYQRLVAIPTSDTAATTPTAASVASAGRRDRKSTRLNSSHVKISYAVFCLKKKRKKTKYKTS